MDRRDVAIIVNSTPSYYYLLPFMIGMIRRYAPELKWDLFLVTEEPGHETVKQLVSNYGVKTIRIKQLHAGFIESRKEGAALLDKQYTYCLPLQDDFILEKGIDWAALEAVLTYMDADKWIASARLMPCPGPKGTTPGWLPGWAAITEEDDYKFVYQATLWRTEAWVAWMAYMCDYLEKVAPKDTTDPKRRKYIEITANIAENSEGQREFWKLTQQNAWKHIAWIRKGNWPNAVYLSPFPYRPTAVVRGQLERWAIDLAKREGFNLNKE